MPGSRQLNPTIAIGIVSSFMLSETDLNAIGYVKQVDGSMQIVLEDVSGTEVA